MWISLSREGFRWYRFRILLDGRGTANGQGLHSEIAEVNLMSGQESKTVSLLIDSNIFIAAEQHGEEGHTFGQDASDLLSLASQLQFPVMVSNGTRADLLRDRPERAARRRRQLEKYHVLDQVPINYEAAATADFPFPLSPNDYCDLEVLSTFLTGVSSWLITNDAKLRKRAKKCSGGGQAFSLSEALETLRRLISPISTIPAIEIVKAYSIAQTASIFDSLKADYPPGGTDPGFESWWRNKVVNGQRDVIILGTKEDPEGIAVIKPENEMAYGLPSPVLKLCTFKVSDEFQGTKRGELLLKSVLEQARKRDLYVVYVEVKPTSSALLGWLEEFGFKILHGISTIRGECVLAKKLAPSPTDDDLNPLDFNIAYGPGLIKLERAHVVPIRNDWHHRLLPEADLQMDLFPAGEACGNAIRKAYLCHSNTGLVRAGDALLFLRTNTGGESSVTCIGVVEKVIKGNSPVEIIGFVGSRTVYSAKEIEEMCFIGTVLAIRFRFDRVIWPTWGAEILRSFEVMNNTAQSISSVPTGGITWLRKQLVESP